MSTITDDTPIVDPATNHSATDHPAGTVHGSPPTRRRRTTLRWVGGGIVLVAAVTTSVVITTDGHPPGTSGEPTHDVRGRDVTELDVHGIPISWSSRGGAPRSDAVTELDVHGIPTWWSAGGSGSRP